VNAGSAALPWHIAKAVCTKRAAQRWSALLTATNSRIAANGIRARLGWALWNEFVRYAERHYRAQWDRLFLPADGELACVGSEDGKRCPHSFRVDLCRESAIDQLGCLHLDHEYDLYVICRAWLAAMPVRLVSSAGRGWRRCPCAWFHLQGVAGGDARAPGFICRAWLAAMPVRLVCWHDGVDARVICQLLFGVSARHGMPACVRFRCGNGRVQKGLARTAWCHQAMTHRLRVLSPEQLVLGPFQEMVRRTMQPDYNLSTT